MNTIFETINENSSYIILGLSVFCFILFILCIQLMININKQKDRTDRFFGVKSEKHNIEAMLLEYIEKVKMVDGKYNETLSLINDINFRLSFCIQKIGIVRYNPFNDMGGDLSFTLALLDDKNNGVVLNTLHGRDASYTYAKPVNSCESNYALTEEEKRAIKIAAEKSNVLERL